VSKTGLDSILASGMVLELCIDESSASALCVHVIVMIHRRNGRVVVAGRNIRISNQFLITRALHFAQLRLRPLNYTLRPNVIVTLA